LLRAAEIEVFRGFWHRRWLFSVFLLRRTAHARSAVKAERGGGDGSGRGMRLRLSAVPFDGAPVDRARLSLPRLSRADRDPRSPGTGRARRPHLHQSQAALVPFAAG